MDTLRSPPVYTVSTTSGSYNPTHPVGYSSPHPVGTVLKLSVVRFSPRIVENSTVPACTVSTSTLATLPIPPTGVSCLYPTGAVVMVYISTVQVETVPTGIVYCTQRCVLYCKLRLGGDLHSWGGGLGLYPTWVGFSTHRGFGMKPPDLW